MEALTKLMAMDRQGDTVVDTEKQALLGKNFIAKTRFSATETTGIYKRTDLIVFILSSLSR